MMKRRKHLPVTFTESKLLDGPVWENKSKFKGLKVRVEGFDFYYSERVGTSTGLGTGFAWTQKGVVPTYGVNTYNHYQTVNSPIYREGLSNAMEELSINTKNDKYDLLLKGGFQDMGGNWSKWYYDIPINIFCIVGLSASTRYDYVCFIRVYRPDGELVKSYAATGTYNCITGTLIPFVTWFDKRNFNPTKGASAAFLAMQKCGLDFLRDFHDGKYDEYLTVRNDK